MVRYIDENRHQYGIEPICNVLPIAPSTHYEQKAREADLERLPARPTQDAQLMPEILRIWNENLQVYGARKVWLQINRERLYVERRTVERLMNKQGIQGVRWNKGQKTTIVNDTADRPLDPVAREFAATRPNQPWVADISYVATWRGMVCTAFVIDVFARMIIGWRVWNSLRTDLVLDALEQARHARTGLKRMVHHSDCGSQTF